MEECDVSRPTLRTALRLLEAQDLTLPDASVTARAVTIALIGGIGGPVALRAAT